ncbi:uncharacterized protein DS421_16g561220 [Arachis hypogaea]|nr:uncharacterized protein DS421_16g561220 [Arachis hypogaea]
MSLSLSLSLFLLKVLGGQVLEDFSYVKSHLICFNLLWQHGSFKIRWFFYEEGIHVIFLK